MGLRGFRLKKAILVFLVTIILGLGLQYYIRDTQFRNPLIKQLQGLPGVLEAGLSKTGFPNRPTRVDLVLDEQVPLALAFSRIWETLEKSGGEFVIYLEDSSDLELWNLFQKIQLVIEEALVTGEFSLLGERVRELAENEGADWELALDRHYIYLRLKNGKSVLQRIISRGAGVGRPGVWPERNDDGGMG